jgi:hypothetical protein
MLTFEKWFLDGSNVVQYAVELTTPAQADRMMDSLQQSVGAFHLRTDGATLTHKPSRSRESRHH